MFGPASGSTSTRAGRPGPKMKSCLPFHYSVVTFPLSVSLSLSLCLSPVSVSLRGSGVFITGVYWIPRWGSQKTVHSLVILMIADRKHDMLQRKRLGTAGRFHQAEHLAYHTAMNNEESCPLVVTSRFRCIFWYRTPGSRGRRLAVAGLSCSSWAK